jgi:hypothetical protein
VGKAIPLAFAGMLFLQGSVVRGSGLAAQEQFTEGEIASAVVTMSMENRCGSSQMDRTDIGQCPTFIVTITGRGTVTYVGTSGVKILGLRTHQIPAEAARELVERFLRTGFFRLKARYSSIEEGAYVTTRDHGVGTTLSLSIGNQSKTVYAFFGVPYAIKDLERRVEYVTDVLRYTGRPPLPAGSHVVGGTVTSTSGSPMPGVNIHVVGDVLYDSVTDRDGRFQIDNVFPGGMEYRIKATANGFVTAESKFNVGEGSTQVTWNPVLKPAR